MSSFGLSADFSTFDQRARHGETQRVIFLGGSLTYGAKATDPQNTSYRGRIADMFAARYPSAHFLYRDAAIGGTGSQLGSFRLERDVLAHRPDLVFLEFTINDNPYAAPDPARLSSYESLARRLVQAGVPVVQLIFPAKVDVGPHPQARPLDPLHKEIAQAYGLPSADLVALARERVKEGKATPDSLWDDPKDGTHPGDAGYALYAEGAFEAFTRGVETAAVCRVPETMLHADTYMTVNRARIAALGPLPAGWAPGAPSRNAVAYDFLPSRWLDGVSVAAHEKADAPPPAPLRLQIQGSDVFVFGEVTPKMGKYRVRIDGGEPAEFKQKTTPVGDLRYVETLAQGLDASRSHLVEILPELEAGQDLRLESVCVAGAPATVVAAP